MLFTRPTWASARCSFIGFSSYISSFKMGKKLKNLVECKHPNSRKTIALAKQLKKESNREKAKLGTAIKQNLIAEKISWFKDQLLEHMEEENFLVCTCAQIQTMIELYLSRFDEEIEQIQLKKSIGMRKNSNQHASREDAIKMTMKRELGEYETCGIELPDLTVAANVNTVAEWNGELRFLQNIKMKRFSRKYLEINSII